MGIKIATLDDLPAVTAMAVKFVKDAYPDFTMDEAHINSYISAFIQSDQGVCMMYDDKGFLLAQKVLSPIGVPTASETAWWVEPESRNNGVGKELIKAFELWAMFMGCKVSALSCLTDEVAVFYEKNDYKLYERTYVKSI